MPNWTKLALKGGGAKGYVYIGVAKALEKLGMMQDIDMVSGASIGSIGALLFATGMKAELLEEIILQTNFEQMLHDAWFGKEVLNLLEYGGIHQGKAFYDWFGQVIETYTGKKDTTFLEWHEYRLKNPHLNMKDIVVEACNINKYFNEVFSWESQHKDVPIRDALRASAAFPYLFTPWQIGKYKYQDGGIQVNCPIQVFNVEDEPDPEAIGIWLSSKDLINHVEHGDPLPDHPAKGLYQQAYALVESSLNTQTYNMMHDVYKDQVILTDTLGVGTLDFGISQAKKEAMIKSGYDAVMEYVKTHDYKRFQKAMGEQKPTKQLEDIKQQLEKLSLEADNEKTKSEVQNGDDGITRPSAALAFMYLKDGAAQARQQQQEDQKKLKSKRLF